MEQASEVLMDDDNDDNDEKEDGMANDEADGKQRSDARMMNIMTLYSGGFQIFRLLEVLVTLLYL